MATLMKLPCSNKYIEHVKKSSSFPSILVQYSPLAPVRKKVHWSRRSCDYIGRPRKRTDNLDDLEKTIEKRGRREMRHLRIDAVAKEQLQRYEIYIRQLHEKVNRQRDEIKRRGEELEHKLIAKEEQRHLARIRPRPHRVSPIHDSEHYKKFPKTRFGKTVLLQDDLRRKGMFRCQDDADQFWRRRMPEYSLQVHSSAEVSEETETLSPLSPRKSVFYT